MFNNINKNAGAVCAAPNCLNKIKIKCLIIIIAPNYLTQIIIKCSSFNLLVLKIINKNTCVAPNYLTKIQIFIIIHYMIINNNNNA